MTSYREWKTIDKSNWPDGPWKSEPDKIQYTDESTGYPCLVKRNLALCGYVGVSPTHPAYGKHYDDEILGEISVHGGLTFTSKCQEISKEYWDKFKIHMEKRKTEALKYPKGDAARFIQEWKESYDSYEKFIEKCHSNLICHIPDPGESDDIWWLGFDCGHLGDLYPTSKEIYPTGFSPSFGASVYRDIDYIKNENKKLAEQLKAMEKTESWAEEVARLQKEIAERQARLQYLICGDQKIRIEVPTKVDTKVRTNDR